MIHDARLEKGLTQEQLADKCGTNKAYISKVENDIKDVRISTLQKIIEVGLGGQLNLYNFLGKNPYPFRLFNLVLQCTSVLFQCLHHLLSKQNTHPKKTYSLSRIEF